MILIVSGILYVLASAFSRGSLLCAEVGMGSRSVLDSLACFCLISRRLGIHERFLGISLSTPYYKRS